MAECLFAIPGDINLPTGGYAYDRRVLALIVASGGTIRHLPLPGTFPDPGAADLAETERALAGVDPRNVLLIDGLAYGALSPDLVRRIAAPIVALVHHPLGLESGLTEARRDVLLQNERVALAHARHVIVTSPTTARILSQDFAVAPARITVAEPGVDRAPRARGSGGKVVRLLVVGSVVPRKGYDVLLAALAALRPLAWDLTIAGSLDRSPETVAALRSQISRLGLDGRVTLAGAVDDAALAGLYHRSDLFVLASHFEGYGMVLAEALARGLPIVTTTGGAAGDTVPDAAAQKVMPGSPRALMWVLGRVIQEPALRAGLADAAWAAAGALPRWETTAATIAGVIRSVCASRSELRT